MSHTRSQRKTTTERLDITPTDLFAIFGNRRRQCALSYLAQRPAATSLGDLAEYIAINEGGLTQERYERICTDLYHTHLPALKEYGVIEYDMTNETVELLVARSAITPYLHLVNQPIDYEDDPNTYI